MDCGAYIHIDHIHRLRWMQQQAFKVLCMHIPNQVQVRVMYKTLHKISSHIHIYDITFHPRPVRTQSSSRASTSLTVVPVPVAVPTSMTHTSPGPFSLNTWVSARWMVPDNCDLCVLSSNVLAPGSRRAPPSKGGQVLF